MDSRSFRVSSDSAETTVVGSSFQSVMVLGMNAYIYMRRHRVGDRQIYVCGFLSQGQYRGQDGMKLGLLQGGLLLCRAVQFYCLISYVGEFPSSDPLRQLRLKVVVLIYYAGCSS